MILTWILPAFAILAGIGMLLVLFLSMARVTILNRRSHDPVLSAVTRSAYWIVKVISRSGRPEGGIQRFTAWYMPIFILFLIASWFLIALTGFVLLYLGAGASPTIGHAFASSGSALSTLGFKTPANGAGEMLSILEGALGLVIVVFILTFVPGFQSAVQTRELQTAWLYRRLGAEPTGRDILIWLEHNVAVANHDAFWNAWENWYRQIRVTHVLAPEVIYTPSYFHDQSWVSTAGAVLDAAALYVTVIGKRTAGAPRMCLEEGIDTLQEIASAIGYVPLPASTQPAAVTQAQFDQVVSQLVASGIQPRPDANGWDVFAVFRNSYEAPIQYISARTLMRNYLEFVQAKPPTNYATLPFELLDKAVDTATTAATTSIQKTRDLLS